MKAPITLAVFVSGGGRSLEGLCERIESGALAARIALVVSDRAGIRALDIARERRLAALVLDWRGEGGAERASASALAAAQVRGCEMLVLAGFLRRLVLSPAWRGRALNIHPALLPRHGGRGYYGERVHAAVLAAGDAESGCTVHLVDDEYDRGAILLQRRVPVLAGDDAARLAARVFEAEREALPAGIELLAARLRASQTLEP